MVAERGILKSGLAGAIIAGCSVLTGTIGGSDLLAEDLDLSAYDVRAKPKPGPVQEFQPIKSLPPVPFELPFDWGMDPYDDRTWRFRLHT